MGKKNTKEPAAFFCPECGSEEVLSCNETLWKINEYEIYRESVKHYDDYAKAECMHCHWEGHKRDLVDKTEEIEAAEKRKADKEYQLYLKLKAKFDATK